MLHFILERALTYLKNSLKEFYKDYVIKLVSLKHDKICYDPRKKTQKLLNIELISMADEPIQWQRGDLFLVLVADFSDILKNIKIYEELENNGVKVWVCLNGYFTHEYNSSFNMTDEYEVDLFEFIKIKESLNFSKISDQYLCSDDGENLVTLIDDSVSLTNRGFHKSNDSYESIFDISWVLKKYY